MELEDQGRIRRMVLAGDWQLDRSIDPSREQTTYRFGGDKSIEFTFYHRGKPLGTRSAANFRSLLDKPPHDLDAEERLSAEVVIRDASEDVYFDIRAERTIDLVGNTVLLVEGFWKLSDADSYGIFVDRIGDGSMVDEIYFIAPPANFKIHLPAIQQSLQSIEWNV